jgi:hypothetical protein
MARQCERPGCARPGEVRYGLEHEHLLVWLDALERVPDDRGGVLCRRHADSMVVPIGWTLDDRRDPTPRLFRAPASTVSSGSTIRRPRPAPAPAVVQLDLTSELERPLIPVAMPEPDEEAIDDPTGWMPVFDQSDDLDGLLQPQTPLLARAFQQRDRRRDQPS